MKVLLDYVLIKELCLFSWLVWFRSIKCYLCC